LAAAALAITLAANDQGVAVMGQAIQGGAGQQLIAKNFGPFGKGAVAGNDQ